MIVLFLEAILLSNVVQAPKNTLDLFAFKKGASRWILLLEVLL